MDAADDPVLFADSRALGRPFAKDPCVIRFGGRLLLYYSIPGFGGQQSWDGWSIGIAESDDGEHWTPIAAMAPADELESTGIAAPDAVVLDGVVHLFYQTLGTGPRDAVLHATSTDGIRFERDASNPIYRSEAVPWSVGRAIDADVVVDGDRALLYYATRDPEMRRQLVGVASAPLSGGFGAGTWTDLSLDGPVMAPELGWETDCIEATSAILRGDRWVMFYAGGWNAEPQQIGAAWSEDGIRWTRYSDDPLLPAGPTGSWNASESGHPDVFEDDDGRTWLYYEGSPDGGQTFFIARAEVTWDGDRPIVVP